MTPRSLRACDLGPLVQCRQWHPHQRPTGAAQLQTTSALYQHHLNRSLARGSDIGFAADPYTFADNRHTVAMASELDELRKALDGMRASILCKLAGLSDADARRSAVPSGTNLAGLVQHLTFVESLWFEEIVSGRSARRGKRSMQVDEAISLATLRPGVSRCLRSQQRHHLVDRRRRRARDSRRQDARPSLGDPQRAGGNRPACWPRGHHSRTDRRSHWPITTGIPGAPGPRTP
jgi:hypothetical protein